MNEYDFEKDDHKIDDDLKLKIFPMISDNSFWLH